MERLNASRQDLSHGQECRESRLCHRAMLLTATPHQHASRNVDGMSRERDVSEVKKVDEEEGKTLTHPITLTPCEMR